MSRLSGLTAVFAIALLTGCASQSAAVSTPEAAQMDVLPGSPIIELLGSAVSYDLDADHAFALDTAPPEATHVRVTVQCTAPGVTGFGTDPGGNNASQQCSEEDIATAADTGWMDIPFGSGDTLYVTLSEGAATVVTLQFARHTPTELGVNADGDTFGVIDSEQGQPDLVAVSGTAPDGSMVEGYVRATDLEIDPMPASPEEAVARQEEREALGLTGWDIPMYESDGRTIIGTFRVGS